MFALIMRVLPLMNAQKLQCNIQALSSAFFKSKVFKILQDQALGKYRFSKYKSSTITSPRHHPVQHLVGMTVSDCQAKQQE